MTQTKTRILAASLDLFNRQGERNVTTNHIAEALGISPGNLYYHFRNKGEIVAALFEGYQERLLALLAAPATPLSWQDKMNYFEGMLAGMWQHRFFHRDLSYFLNNDPTLSARYRGFVSQVLEQGRVIYQEMRASGVLALDDEQLQALLINTWVVMSSWAGLVNGLRPELVADESLEQTLMRQGIYQIICLEEPYLRGEALLHLKELKARYQASESLLPLLLGNTP